MDNNTTRLKESEAQSPNAIETALAQCTPTETENLYKAQEFEFDPDKPTVVIVVGPSGAGKDMLTLGATSQEEFSRAITATSRGKRFGFQQSHLEKAQFDGGIEYAIGQIRDKIEATFGDERANLIKEYIKLGWLDEKLIEPEDAYVWMRTKRSDESDEEYLNALIREYELVENDFHHGSHYGLPAASLKVATDSGKLPVIRTEPAGAKTIQRNLANTHNVLIIGVMPQNLEIMKHYINMREHVEKRLKESLDIVAELPKLSHFIIHNIWGKQEETIKKFIDVVKLVTKS